LQVRHVRKARRVEGQHIGWGRDGAERHGLVVAIELDAQDADLIAGGEREGATDLRREWREGDRRRPTEAKGEFVVGEIEF
jgi:hypothetical protein